MKKRGAIELSVNAIVVFVIALGMLGVGWFIINMLREKSGDTIDNVFKLEDLQNPPTAKEPMVLEDDIKIKFGQKTKLRAGFYNTEDKKLEDIVFTLRSCTDSDNDPVNAADFPKVISSMDTLDPSTGAAFTILINHEGAVHMSAGTYVCVFAVQQINIDANTYDTKSVFLTVTA